MNFLVALLIKVQQFYRLSIAAYRLKRTDSKEEQKQAEAALANLMAQSRGLTMKIGQLMAGHDDNNAFQELVSSIQPLSLKKITPTLEQQLNAPVQQIFLSIEESQAAASLGQVHHAILKNERQVAVKIRYPNIVKSIQAELKFCQWLPDAGPIKRWNFDSSDYKNILHRQLLRETDYRIELQTQTRFREKLQVEGLTIPTVYPELSNDGLLIQSWEQGVRFSEACHWPKKERLLIARTLLVTLFQSFFVHGEIHADPHPGNYLFRRTTDGQTETVLLDFGSTIFVSKPRRLALLKLIHAYQSGRQVNALQCFVTMGFDEKKLSHITEKLDDLSQILLYPFLVTHPFHTKAWQLSESLQVLLDEQRWWFRAAGPADLLLLLRAFHGLSQQLQQLDIAIPWWPLLKFTIGDTLLEQASTLEMIPVSHIESTRTQNNAQKLCIRISENKIEVIALDLPAEAALDLGSVIPLSVLKHIERNINIDLSELTKRLQKTGLTPQTLFEFTSDKKQHRIWLE